MMEWKTLYGYSVLYEVSSKGQIRTKYHGKRGYKDEYIYLKPTDNGKGYMRVNLERNGKKRTEYVHRLVAMLFVPNPNKYNEINHKDENKKNNDANNLEWCARAYNCNYGTRNKKISKQRKTKVECVELQMMFDSEIEAAEAFGVCKSAIGNCLKGRSKSCAGYSWRYVDV